MCLVGPFPPPSSESQTRFQGSLIRTHPAALSQQRQRQKSPQQDAMNEKTERVEHSFIFLSANLRICGKSSPRARMWPGHILLVESRQRERERESPFFSLSFIIFVCCCFAAGEGKVAAPTKERVLRGEERGSLLNKKSSLTSFSRHAQKGPEKGGEEEEPQTQTHME